MFKIFPAIQIAEICRRYQVKELCLFGSAARGQVQASSDIDLLVDFLPDARPGLLGLSAMTREFSSCSGEEWIWQSSRRSNPASALESSPTPNSFMRRDLEPFHHELYDPQ